MRKPPRFFAIICLLGIFFISIPNMWAQEPSALKPLVAQFDFTKQSFQVFIKKYLEPIYCKKIENQMLFFLELLAAVIKQQKEKPYLSRLVDKKHSLPKTYVPTDLVALKQYPELNLARKNLYLRKLLIADILEMNRAALASGVSLFLGSAYRSFDYQKTLFQRYTQHHGLALANRYSARAGQSQHQLGLAIDFIPISRHFENTPASQWLQQNALSYGFSLSYPKGVETFTGYIYEPWHYRYVGKPIAKLISQYFAGLQYQFYSFWQKAIPELKKRYQG